MLPILAAVLAFITIGGLGWVFVGGEDSSSQALKRAQTLAEGKKNPPSPARPPSPTRPKRAASRSWFSCRRRIGASARRGPHWTRA